MTTQQSIQPLNIAAATLLIQVILVTLIGITTSIYTTRVLVPDETYRVNGQKYLLGGVLRRSPTLFVTLFSIAVLLISDELYLTWSPIFQGVGINTISTTTAINLVFGLDLVLVGYLIYSTGGSRKSPFVAALLTIPALAIFLRLPPSLFIAYAVIAAVIYIIFVAPIRELGQPTIAAVTFMNIACLLLTMFTGYITRPVSISDLKPSTLPAPQHEDRIPQAPG